MLRPSRLAIVQQVVHGSDMPQARPSNDRPCVFRCFICSLVLPCRLFMHTLKQLLQTESNYTVQTATKSDLFRRRTSTLCIICIQFRTTSTLYVICIQFKTTSTLYVICIQFRTTNTLYVICSQFRTASTRYVICNQFRTTST